MSNRWISSIALAASLITIADVGCGTGSTTPPVTSPLSQPASTAPVRLYISDGGNPGTIKAYAWPRATLGVPLATVAGDNGPTGLAIDSVGNLYVSNRGGVSVQAFAHPINNGSSPGFTLNFYTPPHCNGPPRDYSCGPNGQYVGDVAVDGAGDLALDQGYSWYSHHCIGGAGCFNLTYFSSLLLVYATPVSSSTSPHEIVLHCTRGFFPSCLNFGFGKLAFDPNGNLWAIRTDGHLDEYTPPFGSTTTPALELSIAASDVKFDAAGNMYVSTTNTVDVYRPPFSQTITKAFSINVASPGYLAFDAAGKLYVSSAGTTVLVFAPPFTGASMPVVTLPVDAAGLAIGR